MTGLHSKQSRARRPKADLDKQLTHSRVQRKPGWDATIHNLNHMKLTPRQLAEKHAAAVSKNKLPSSVHARHALQRTGTDNTEQADTSAIWQQHGQLEHKLERLTSNLAAVKGGGLQAAQVSREWPKPLAHKPARLAEFEEEATLHSYSESAARENFGENAPPVHHSGFGPGMRFQPITRIIVEEGAESPGSEGRFPQPRTLPRFLAPPDGKMGSQDLASWDGKRQGFQSNTSYQIIHDDQAPSGNGYTNGYSQEAEPARVQPKVVKDALASSKAEAPAEQAVAEVGAGDSSVADQPPSGLRPVGEAESGAVQVTLPPPSGKLIHANDLLNGIVVGCVVLNTLVLLKLFQPSIWTIILYALLGAPLGLAYSWLFRHNMRSKLQMTDVLNITPGRKGLTTMLGGVPSWVAFQDKEKVEWLNKAISEVWPVYNKAIAEMVKTTVEPIMEQYKPPGLIKRIYFKQLTFGGSPMTIDNIWVEDEGEQHVCMEVAFRWAGEANIAIAIELPAGGDATRMVPKVSDLDVRGTCRVILAPLVDEVPGFGAAVIALRKPPMINFKLNFGKALGSAYTAKAVRLWLDPFLRETLANLVVWPNRVLVPILPESVTGPLDALQLRHVGVLKVTVVEADGLRKMDLVGKSDPFVELYTRPEQVEKTAHKKHTLEPQWDATFWLLVQEPKTQLLRLQVFDHDSVHVKELLNVNVMKGLRESVGAKTFMGRAAVPLRPLLTPGDPQEKDAWYDLGKKDWAAEGGPGKGEGRLRLKLKYMSFPWIYSRPRDAGMGAVLVKLVRANDLPAADSTGVSDPYVKLKLMSEKHKSTIKPKTLAPVWDEKFEWLNVPKEGSQLTLEVFDNDAFGEDEYLGMAEIEISSEVAASPTSKVLKTWWLEEVPADSKTKIKPPASVTLEVQWVPFDFTD
ncbi:hypothetical protein WJX72_004641 [[Myrmecia] bisecta]|uniref:Uncharacterized protein n=1 Tax=[Myrmecia] bisecta TaxID=41462 RepID=A0AAW1PG13_9CHLO